MVSLHLNFQNMLPQTIINLYDEYTHKPLSRLEFIQKLTKLAGSMSAAMAILPLLESNYSRSLSINVSDLYTESKGPRTKPTRPKKTNIDNQHFINSIQKRNMHDVLY